MHPSLEIAGKTIGANAGVLVIAELGVNHNGDLRRALELVEIAAAAGSDAIKLQIFSAGTLMHKSAEFAAYQKAGSDQPTPADMLRQYELTDEAIAKVVAFARKKKLIPLATPFSPGDVARVAALDLPAVKIASPDIVNWPLLSRAAKLGRPLLISTGAATMEEILRTCGWLDEWKAPAVVLHCISSYPTPNADAHLGWIAELAAKTGRPIGYSDHTNHPLAGALAVAAGACVIEKHLTFDRSAPGPDHAASFDGDQFANYVRAISDSQILFGGGPKTVLPIERDVRTVSRQSIVAAIDLPRGHVLRESDLTVARPGTGIGAEQMLSVIGRTTQTAIARGTMISASDL
jgi:N,N'-diacetyllegionaminate synthase